MEWNESQNLRNSRSAVLHRRRILTAEITWLKRLLRITRRDRMRNETVRSTIQQERTLVDRIAERRLAWLEHFSRMGSERLPAKVLGYIGLSTKSKEDNRRSGWTL